jgi:hypothetical protein
MSIAAVVRPPDTLVLGMAFISASYAVEGAASEKQGTTNAGVRDRARLLELEQLSGHKIVSMNDVHSVEQCEPGQHLQARFDRRAVGELIGEFGQDGWLALDAIYADYFRFPTAYMRDAYSDFLRSMLPALISSGVMGVGTQLIMPNLAGLLDAMRADTKRLFQRPAGLPNCRLAFELIAADENALYVATTAAEGASPDAFGGFTNAREIEQLDTAHPFVRIRIDDGSWTRHVKQPAIPRSRKRAKIVHADSAAAASASVVTASTGSTCGSSGSELDCGGVAGVALASHSTKSSASSSSTVPYARFSVWPPNVLCTDPSEYTQLCDAWRLMSDSEGLLQVGDPEEPIRNGGRQKILSLTHPLHQSTETYLRRGLERAIGKAPADALLLVGLAQLRTMPGDGPMPVHCDMPVDNARLRAHAACCYAVLFFPDDCQSTILPKLSADQHDAAMARIADCRRLLVPHNFFTMHFSGGTLLVFRGDVFHASPKNKSDRTRLAVYGLFSPSTDPVQLNTGFFPLGDEHVIHL